MYIEFTDKYKCPIPKRNFHRQKWLVSVLLQVLFRVTDLGNHVVLVPLYCLPVCPTPSSLTVRHSVSLSLLYRILSRLLTM